MEAIADVFGLDVRLVLIQAFNFGLVLLVLWYFLYRPLIGLIEERRQKIIRGEVDAEEAAKKLAEADTSKQEIVTEATREAERIVAESRDFGKTKEGEIVTGAQQRAEQILRDAELSGQEQKRRLLDESREEIARMVVLGAERVLREKLENDRASA